MASSSDKTRGYIPPQNAQEQLLLKRITELVDIVRQRGFMRTTMFLNEREQLLARTALGKASWENYTFDGGFPGAQRQMLCIYDGAPPQDLFSFTALQIRVAFSKETLCHRDYLGAVMALGVKRECMGDIILNSEGAVIIVAQKVAPLIENELREVGRCNVSVGYIGLEQIQPLSGCNAQIQTASVASLRLDALLAAMLKSSRSRAAQLIESGFVMVNHVLTTSVHCEVFAQDEFSIRGKGKFALVEIGSKSKKGRTFVSYLQY